MKKYLLLWMLFLPGLVLAGQPLGETPFSVYKFPSDQCRIIDHNQSRIFVPGNCFYLDGQIYKGEVTMNYREFLDQLDIIINQVPLQFSAAGEQHTLESGGMFELYAYASNGKLLSFSPDKKIVVQLATQFPYTKGLESFYLDKQTNNWQKQTSFNGNKEANNAVSDNDSDLWDDALWNNIIQDEVGQLWQTAQASSINVEEIRNKNFKTLQVDKMGIYNCDRILNEETIPFTATFNVEGAKFPVTNYVYVVYKNKNSLFYYYPAKEMTMKLLPDEPVAMFMFANDGTIATVDPQFLASFDVKANANKTVNFKLKKLPKKPLNKQELAELTGL